MKKLTKRPVMKVPAYLTPNGKPLYLFKHSLIVSLVLAHGLTNGEKALMADIKYNTFTQYISQMHKQIGTKDHMDLFSLLYNLRILIDAGGHGDWDINPLNTQFLIPEEKRLEEYYNYHCSPIE